MREMEENVLEIEEKCDVTDMAKKVQEMEEKVLEIDEKCDVTDMAKKVQEMEKKMQDVIELATLGILFYCFVTRRYGIGLAVLTVLGITRLQSFEKEIPN